MQFEFASIGVRIRLIRSYNLGCTCNQKLRATRIYYQGSKVVIERERESLELELAVQ